MATQHYHQSAYVGTAILLAFSVGGMLLALAVIVSLQ